ncbi:MAG: hypothetical protein IPJ34_40445 [Myxococcales bacterium]|nr:hypothetical protein [Myxococcales bacterium]
MRVSPPPTLEDSTRVALGAFGCGVFLTMTLATTLARLDPRVGAGGVLLGFALVALSLWDDAP